MKTVSAAEANRKFSQLLREVREGQSFVVTSHGTPVATIAPAGQGAGGVRERARTALLARLENQPATDVGPWIRGELYDE